MPSWEKELKWLPVGDARNPFLFDVLDCRAACAALKQLTIKETVTQTMSTIEDIIQTSPSPILSPDHIRTNCAININLPAPLVSLAERISSGAGNKWLLQFALRALVARRRWTGQTIHVGEFDCQTASITVTHLASEKLSVFNDATYATAELEFLLKIYLEESQAAFPIPRGLDRNNKTKIALHGWKVHGPIAEFARILPAD